MAKIILNLPWLPFWLIFAKLMPMVTITDLHAREIFDSRGNPTVEVDIKLDDGSIGRASVPSGASTGDHEAIELRDGDQSRLHGQGVLKAVGYANQKIKQAVLGESLTQAELDQLMIELDGTPNKSQLGANSILAVSMAFAKATAQSHRLPLYEYFRSLSRTVPGEYVLPVPQMNIMNGGRHAEQSADFQEFMILPIGAESFSQAMEMGVTVFHTLKKMLHDLGQPTSVGDEGGFAPHLKSNEEALDLIMQAVTKSGYELGTQIALGMDVAASEFYENGQYVLASEKRTLEPAQLLEMYVDWVNRYPIISIEDGFDQDAWADHRALTEKLGSKIQIVGDDLFVTNVKRLQRGINEQVANAILIKVNQIGSITETVAAIDLARQNGYRAIVSHRSGETEDTTIADLVVGLSTGQIKTGSMSRSERMAKYNQVLRLEEELGERAVYQGDFLDSQ
jgi:enolase